MISPISLQICPCLNNSTKYHISTVCFIKRAWVEILGDLTFFGSHKNFAGHKKPIIITFWTLTKSQNKMDKEIMNRMAQFY